MPKYFRFAVPLPFLVAIAAMSAVACSSSTSTGESVMDAAAHDDSGAQGGEGAAPTGDAGTDAGAASDAGGASGAAAASDAGGAGSLYARLGGHAGIRAQVDAVDLAEFGDPEIASYFVYQTISPTPAGHPTADQIAECLTDMFANALGGPEPYPTTVTDDAGTWTCRDMTAIHAAFHISGGTLAKFVMIAAGELQQLGLSADEINAIGAVFVGAGPQVVDPALADAGEAPFEGPPGSPSDGGSDASDASDGGPADAARE